MLRLGSAYRRSIVLAILVYAAILLSACVHVPLSHRADYRLEQYLRTHTELTPAVRDAMWKGHVLAGMDTEQVRVVLGEPIRRARFGEPGSPTSVWLYPGHRLHQEQFHGDRSTLFRLVFLDGRLVLVEPL